MLLGAQTAKGICCVVNENLGNSSPITYLYHHRTRIATLELATIPGWPGVSVAAHGSHQRLTWGWASELHLVAQGPETPAGQVRGLEGGGGGQ